MAFISNIKKKICLEQIKRDVKPINKKKKTKNLYFV